MNIETEEYRGFIAYYIFGKYSGDKRYTLKITKENKVLRDCHGFTCNGAKTEFHRWVDKKLENQSLGDK